MYTLRAKIFVGRNFRVPEKREIWGINFRLSQLFEQMWQKKLSRIEEKVKLRVKKLSRMSKNKILYIEPAEDRAVGNLFNFFMTLLPVVNTPPVSAQSHDKWQEFQGRVLKFAWKKFFFSWKNFRVFEIIYDFAWKTFRVFCFEISQGINFRKLGSKTRKTRKFLPAKISALKVSKRALCLK